MEDLFVPNSPGQINALHLSEEYRLRVLAILLDGVIRQHHAGIDQRDLAPRDVCSCRRPMGPACRRASAARGAHRYNIATVWEMTKYGKLPAQLARLPPNPMKRFWRVSLSDFDGWVPLEWYLNKRLCQKWLRREFGGEKKALFETLDESFYFLSLCPLVSSLALITLHLIRLSILSSLVC